MAEAKKTAVSKKKTVEKPVKKTAKVVATPKKKTPAEEKAIIEKIKKADEAIVDAEATEIVAEAVVEAKMPTKAGKRSPKALKEAEERQAKEERKASQKEAEITEAAKPRIVQKSRPVIERRAKGYRKSAEQLETGKAYDLDEALDLATKTSHVKFDATVELHIRLGVDPRQADQNLRDIVVLPAGTGKTVRIAVYADPDGVAVAKKAGADIAAADEFLQQLDKGTIDFDVLIATPAQMPKLGKYARILGPKGLMPNPKSGTVTTDIAKAVTEAKAGRTEYRVDSTGIVHLGVGKVSFGKDLLIENVRVVLSSIRANKPASIKSTYVKSIYVTTSMGPSISVKTTEV